MNIIEINLLERVFKFSISMAVFLGVDWRNRLYQRRKTLATPVSSSDGFHPSRLKAAYPDGGADVAQSVGRWSWLTMSDDVMLLLLPTGLRSAMNTELQFGFLK